MKTKFNKYISLALLIIVGASCSDNFLEEKKQYNYFDDEFYQSEERVNWYVNNVYYDFFDAYKSPMGTVVGSFATTQASYTEEVGGISNNANDKSFINPNFTWENAADASAYYGTPLADAVKNEPYNRIRDCNSMLENIDIKGANLSQVFRNRIKGQMYYLRAIQYFDLMRTYGGVPIVTTVENATNNNPATQLPRAKVSEVVAQIVSDLDMAASLLPTAAEWGAAEYGRYTKGAALAQKSRVLLTYASPLFNKNWESPERWDAALKAGLEAETQLIAAGHNLYGASASDWAKMFYISDNSFNPEAITVRLLASGTTNLNSNNSWEKSIRLASQGGAAGSGVKAPKRMIDLFPMANGKRPTAANLYDPFLFFKDRDPRFYRTFAFSGSYWPYTNSVANTTTQPTVWAYRWSTPAANTFGFSMGNDVPSPAFVRKMSSPTVGNASNFQYSGTDIIDYRFAELLLNIAECYAALGQTNNTLAYLGRIRNRVGIPAANNYGIGTLGNKYEAIEACLYERRVELAYEGKRFWDIQRWMLYSNDAGTCSKLGLEPINGTQRVGNYLHYKIGNSAVNNDPLTSARASISVDPDAANFQAQITALAAFYTTNFELRSPPTPMDNIGGTATNINFRQNYYIQGLSQAVLAQNPWLKQTVGWKDANGASGTYDYQE
ncbi:RagB/SusD family nutrient uptake outer membrane protein [Flavobacterium johnsoniae]|jgi:hypothetical protein|uniref:RagB/SusD family nutrient uptake outer membrane protein n=1 Tax=Flavobacterium johnsoniae TaxID=986 RepID=UPI0011ED43E7|nr:RagB/SusD family nutrient uptake outer membrane protein [Flavobacterium johnsoniae]